MSEEKQIIKNEEQMETTETALDPRVKDPGFWREIWEQIRLVWLLLRDNEVPVYLKLLPLAAAIYIISPADLMPAIPFGPLASLDDLTVFLVGAKMFIEMSPQDVVNRHIRAMRMQYGSANLDDVEPSEKEIDASIVIEGEFERLEEAED